MSKRIKHPKSLAALAEHHLDKILGEYRPPKSSASLVDRQDELLEDFSMPEIVEAQVSLCQKYSAKLKRRETQSTRGGTVLRKR